LGGVWWGGGGVGWWEKRRARLTGSDVFVVGPGSAEGPACSGAGDAGLLSSCSRDCLAMGPTAKLMLRLGGRPHEPWLDSQLVEAGHLQNKPADALAAAQARSARRRRVLGAIAEGWRGEGAGGVAGGEAGPGVRRDCAFAFDGFLCVAGDLYLRRRLDS